MKIKDTEKNGGVMCEAKLQKIDCQSSQKSNISAYV
jgi:hypothetical protein